MLSIIMAFFDMVGAASWTLCPLGIGYQIRIAETDYKVSTTDNVLPVPLSPAVVEGVEPQDLYPAPSGAVPVR